MTISSNDVRSSDAEARRLEALHRYDVIDTSPEEAFDRITDLAAHLLDVPIAIITFIGNGRQWFKSCVGVEGKEPDLDLSFCVRTIESDGVLVVEDARVDPRFESKPLVADKPELRFYAGVPLVTSDGYRIGTLCTLDTQPRSPSEADLRQLENLAEMVMDELELRRQMSERERTEEKVRRIVENAQPIVFMVDREGEFMLSEGQDLEAIGLEPGEAVGESVYDMFAEYPDALAIVDRALAGHTASEVVTLGDVRFDVWCAPFHDSFGEIAGCVGMSLDITERKKAQEELRESERRHREFLEQSPVGIYRSTPDGRFLYANDALVDMLGFDSFEAMAERNLNEEGFGLADREAFVADLNERGSVKQRETTWIGPNGETVDLLESAHVVEENGTTIYEGIVEDITERKRAERELRRSRARLANAQRIAGLGSWERDLKQDELYWSDETRRIFGWEEDEPVTFEKFMASVHPEDRSELRRQQMRAIDEGEPVDVQYRVLRSGVEDRIIHEQGEAVLNDDGEVVRVSGTVLDVTEREKAEQQLQKSNQRLRLALEAANAGTFEYDVVTGRSDWDARTIEIYGLSGEQRTADPPAFYSLVHPDDRADLKARLEQVIEGEDQYEVSYRVVRPDGEERYVLSSGIVERDDEGNAKRIIGLNQDITKRERAEQKLRRSRERWQRLVNAHRDPIQIAVNGTIRYINPAGAELFGASSPDEIVGRSVLDFTPHEEVTAAVKARRKKLDRGEPTAPFEHEIERIDGERRIIESYSVPIEYEDQRAAQTVLRDVTEQRRAERELRESKAELEEERQRLEMALIGGELGLWDVNLETGDAVYDERWAGMLGYSMDEIKQTQAFFESLVHPDDFPRVLEALERQARGEIDVMSLDIRMKAKDGAWRWIRNKGKVMETNDDGSPRRAVGTHQDVTDERRRQEALRRSKKKYESLFETSNEAIFIHTLEGQIRDVNSRACTLFGYAQEEIVGRNVTELVPPERRRASKELETLSEGESVHSENKYARKDGSEFWGELSAAVFETEEGRLVQGMIRDITDEKQAKEALRHSRKKYKSLFDTSNDAIFIHDLSGTIRDANVQARDLFGYTHEQLVGRSVTDLVPPDLHDATREKLRTLQRGESVHAENKYQRRDGTTFWGELSATAFEVDEDHLVQGMIRDVTDRKTAEQARRESEARLRGLANSVPGIIFQFYTRPDGEYGLHFVSEQAESVLGLDPDPDGFFERFADRVDPGYREEFLESVDEAVQNAEPWNLEIPFCKPSGDTIWVQGVSTPEERADELVFNGVLLDITRRKQLESQLRQAQKMETVGTLAGGIAHDFNNILHAAMVYLQMGLEELPEGHSTLDYLNRAEKGLRRAETLVDKLLTFSRQEGKTSEECVNMSAVIRETIELAESSIPNPVQVRTEMNEECRVIGDPGQLQQVAMNLLTNAAQALETQQKETDSPLVLDIDVRSTEVDEDLAGRYLNLDPGRYVRMSISDTGPGMDQETKERIFEPFFTTKDVGKGTGLGLSVVHGIVQAHDGEITVFTQPGEGTTFNVYVPCASEGKAADEATKTAEEGSSGHILFVDDDEQVLDLETVRLRGFGYEVTTRRNAQTALEAVEAAPEAYDLVLTDYAMPGMSGMKLIREIKDRGYEVPIILMSGFSAKVSEEDVLQAGAEMFLRKPVGSSELEDALTDVLD